MLASKVQHAGEGKELSYERLLAWGMMTWGCRKATMEDYLDVLTAAGLIECLREKDTIVWVGSP